MARSVGNIDQGLPLPQIRSLQTPTVADKVFAVLQQRILTLELPPGTKLSETEVAKTMGVSRQPVREAFKRLAKLDFLLIRPQSGTTVSLISEEAVLRARYIRTALEVHTCRTACELLGPKEHRALRSIIDAQNEAINESDRDGFHALDDHFHRQICILSGVGYVWDLIHDNKAHMDRVRMLSLSSTSQQYAVKEHTAILDAIEQGDADAAAMAFTNHLSRILLLIEEIKADNHRWFTDL
ncbi:MAG: GntR family transcriptional regulator [Granulosicoccus sp.]